MHFLTNLYDFCSISPSNLEQCSSSYIEHFTLHCPLTAASQYKTTQNMRCLIALCTLPQLRIPDFVNDNESEFANLKLAFDNLLGPLSGLEKYKYHILLEHIKLPEAQIMGQACQHHPIHIQQQYKLFNCNMVNYTNWLRTK